MTSPDQRPAAAPGSPAAAPSSSAVAQRQAGAPPAPAKRDPIPSLLTDPTFQRQIAAALPRHMTADRMCRIALTEVRKNPDLLKCDQLSFAAAVLQVSQLGLEPGNGLGHAYLIPYGQECTLVIGYRGLIELVMRSGAVRKVVARIVKSGDDFDYAYGLDERLDHVPADEKKRGPVTHVYGIAWRKDGENQFEVMTVADVEKIRQRGPSRNSPAWKNDFEEMARKTVIRRLCKHLPQSPELQRALDLDYKAAGEVLDGTALLDGLNARSLPPGETIDAQVAGGEQAP